MFSVLTRHFTFRASRSKSLEKTLHYYTTNSQEVLSSPGDTTLEWLNAVYKLKSNFGPQKLLADERFRQFVNEYGTKVQEIEQTENIMLQLSWIYRSGQQKIPENLIQLYLTKLDSDGVHDIQTACTALSILSLNKLKPELGAKIASQCMPLINRDIHGSVLSSLLTSFQNLRIKNYELMKLLEPFIIAQMDSMTGSEVLHVLTAYLSLKSGSDTFLKQVLYNVQLKADELKMKELSLLLHTWTRYLLNRFDDMDITGRFIIGRMIPKLNQCDKKTVATVLPLLSVYGIGDPNIYELFSIEVVKYIDQFSKPELIKIVDAFALGNIRSKTLCKVLAKHILYLISAEEDVTAQLSGFLGKSADSEAADLINEIRQEVAKSQTQTTNDDVPEILDLYWGYLKMSLQYMEEVDSFTWQNLWKSLTKWVENRDTVTWSEYQKLSMVLWTTHTFFPTFKKIKPHPRVHNYTQFKKERNEQTPTHGVEFLHRVAQKFEQRDLPYCIHPSYVPGKFNDKLIMPKTGILANAYNSQGIWYLVIPQEGYLGDELNGFYSFMKFVLDYEKINVRYVNFAEWAENGQAHLDRIIS